MILSSVSYVKSANILSEIDSELQEQILQVMKPKDIADVIEEMDSDDATDMLSDLDEAKKEEIFSLMQDKELVEDIEELSAYAEDTA